MSDGESESEPEPEPDPVDGVLARYLDGELSAEVALMQLLLVREDAAEVGRLVAGDPALAALFAAHEGGARRIAEMLRSGLDTSEPAPDIDAGIAHARRLFDWSVQQSPEASVAMYSLGSPDVLARATAEIVDLYRARGWLGPARRALQIGCGIGRIEEAIAPLVAHAHGIDVSPNMIDAARRRCAHLASASFAVCSGRDLAGHDRCSFDFVHAVDSFPYVVQAGGTLAADLFAEVARVLVPGGDFVIANYAYTDADPVPLAAAHFDVVTADERPFRLWDGRVWHFRKQ